MTQAKTERGVMEIPSQKPGTWKRTAKDMAIAAAGTGLGYGVGRTAVELLGKQLQNQPTPSWMKYMPYVASGLGAGTGLAQGKVREILRKRREET